MNWNRNSMGVRIVKEVADILGRHRDIWPFTLRQIHYQLVKANVPEYANTKSKYKQLSDWLYNARVAGLIPWEAVEDRERSFMDLSGFSNRVNGAAAYLRYMRDDYQRNLLQTQDERLEIWTEKDALSSVLTRFARPYCVPVAACKGFGSGSQFHAAAERNGSKPLRILYFGDHDPSGLWMSERDIATRLEEKHGFPVTLERIALNGGQVQDYGLSADFQTPKGADTRSKWYIKNYGNQCWELDALPIDVLGAIVTEAIESRIDLDLYQAELPRHEQDAEIIGEWATEWAAGIGVEL